MKDPGIYKKRLLWLILISAAVRIIAASVIELGNDEVYYYTYALHLQENYFDHPPGVALLIKLFTFNLALQQELFIRLGAIFCAAAGTLLSYKIGSTLRNQHTGWLAALLYNTSIYTSVIAGIFIMPDSPQIVFWLSSLLVLIQIIQASNSGNKIPLLHWIIFGLSTGICIMCKVHGIFLWGGFGLYILFYKRNLLKEYGLYLAALITLLIISPIIQWDFQNNFVMWTYDSGRMVVHQFSIDKDSFIQTIFGQIFYNNPINVVLIILAIAGINKTDAIDKDSLRILLLCGIPLVITVTTLSLFNPVLPHWSGPGFASLSFIGAVYLDVKQSTRKQCVIPVVLKSSTVLILFLIAGGIGMINFYPGTIGSHDNRNEGELDFTLDMAGWKSFANEFRTWEKDQEKQKRLEPDLKIVCNKWFPASHLEYYVAKPMNTAVIGVGNLNDLHQFVWLNHYQGQLKKGEDALCIVPSNYPTEPCNTYKNSFASVTLLHSFSQYRDNKLTRRFDVYLLKGYKDNDEAATFKIGH